ncbi:MAG: polyphosphate polymerase domain-containing protein [Opitutales bacterium]
MVESRLQTQRLELKYIIPEDLADRIRDFLLPFLEIDAFGARQADRSYPVHSLYLDSPDLHTYHSTINGDRNRYKLRIRFYEGRPGAPVFFEIKRRQDNAIYKQRCAVLREAVDEVIAGALPDRRCLVKDGPDEEGALYTFCRLVNQLQARPVAHVAYRREAWYSHGNNRTRVTMDRNVRSCREPSVRLDARLTDPVAVFGDGVVLELKFTGRFPDWMRELVQVFGLEPCSAAKYVDGIVRIKESAETPVMPTVDGARRRRPRNRRPSAQTLWR